MFEQNIEAVEYRKGISEVVETYEVFKLISVIRAGKKRLMVFKENVVE